MFGYIVPKVCELKVKEYELYKAYYCGLCKTLKSEYNRTAVLNYDCTFIYLLADSLAEEQTDVQPCKCLLHPIQKRQAVYGVGAEYAAAINLLMAYASAKDDVLDRGGWTSRVQTLLLKKPYKKAAAEVPGITEEMLVMAEDLRTMEVAQSSNTDAVADTYAKLLGTVLEELDVLQSHILYDLGYSLGRWVYLIDAYDDIEEDIKNDDFNVFVNKYNITNQVPEQVEQEALFGFNFTLSRAMQALERLELKKNRVLLENIIGLGLKEKTKTVMGMEQFVPAGKEPDESLSGTGR